MAVRKAVSALAVASALGLGWGWAAPASAYTVKQTDSGATVRWHANSVALRIDSSMDRYFQEMGIRPLVREAAQAWHGLPGVPELLINDGEPGPKGFEKGGPTNGVYLIENWDLAESSLAVTVATFESRSGKIVDTDILVNANHPFTLMPDGPDQPAEAFDLRGVLTHEMGHVLGLGESYDVRMATMWPNIARGETHQRDIDVDDEAGVETAYQRAILSETESPAGCGGASVVVQRAHGPSTAMWLIFAGGLIGIALWMRLFAGDPKKKRAIPMFALVLLFGAPFEASDGSANERAEVLRTLSLRRRPPSERRVGLLQAASAQSKAVRMAAAAVMERSGAREDLSIASKLALDADLEVRKAAQNAIEKLRTAPPLALLSADHPEAQQRLAQLLSGATDVIEGEAVSVGTEMKNGLIWSRYLVHGKDDVVEVKIPGGSLGELTQVVSEQEAPADGDALVVALHEQGPHAWAHVRDGKVYGGWLGEGAAIEWKSVSP